MVGERALETASARSKTQTRVRSSGLKHADYFAEKTDMAACLPRLSRAVVSTLAFAFCTLVTHPAASEIYRWTDAQGQLHFSSDLNQVPERYRDQTAASEPTKSSISVLGDGVTPGPGERARAVEERVRDLRLQEQRSALRKQPALPTPKADREPQKYEYNCRKRTNNGRCQRFRTAAWDAWRKRQ